MPQPAPVAILGAGPIGLHAALACADAGWPFTVYEAANTIGAHVRDWGHVRLFTPWNLNVSGRMRARVPEAPRGSACPTGAELAAELLDPIADHPDVAAHLRTRTRVAAIARSGLLKHEQIGTGIRDQAPFTLLLDTPDGEQTATAGLILDCTGTYGTPNSLGDGGNPALGERALGDGITRTIPTVADPTRWAGTVLLVGAGKSAQTAARDLAELPGTHVEWIIRHRQPDWGTTPGDPLPGRAQLTDSSRDLAGGASPRVQIRTGAHVQALHQHGGRIHAQLATTHGPQEIICDHIVSLTGYTGDPTLHRQLHIHECYATAAPMNLSATLLGAAGSDCLTQPDAGIDTLRSPEPHYFVLGAKSYGRLPTFLLRTGYDQVDEVTAAYSMPTAAAP